METTLQRIKEFIDHKKLSVRSFEKSAGFSNGAFANQLKNGKTIGLDKVENILQSFPELSVEWLLTGEGKMLKFEPVELTKGQLSAVNSVTDQIGEQMKAARIRIIEENKINENVAIRHIHKIYDVLKEKYPELYTLKKNFDTLQAFKDAIEAIENQLGDSLQNAFWMYPKGKFEMKRYEEQVVAELSKLLPFDKPLNEITIAIDDFYKNMQAISENKIDFSEYTVN